jgi:hypothetical protein
MIRMEAVAERMGHDFVGYHALVPGVGKTAQAVDAAGGFEESLHAGIMTRDWRQRKGECPEVKAWALKVCRRYAARAFFTDVIRALTRTAQTNFALRARMHFAFHPFARRRRKDGAPIFLVM